MQVLFSQALPLSLVTSLLYMRCAYAPPSPLTWVVDDFMQLDNVRMGQLFPDRHLTLHRLQHVAKPPHALSLEEGLVHDLGCINLASVLVLGLPYARERSLANLLCQYAVEKGGGRG